MKIDPRNLILFATLIEEGSFTRAAQALGIAQPAISKSVAALETRLGQSLLRRRRPLEPTETGRLLAASGIQVRSIVDETSRKVALMKQGRLGHIRVGAPPVFCEDVLAQLVLQFHKENPLVSFELESAYAPELRDKISERKLDVALAPIIPSKVADDIHQSNLMDVTHAIVGRQSFKPPDNTSLNDFLNNALWLDHAGESHLQSDALNALARMGVSRRDSFTTVKSGAALFNLLLSIDSLAVLPIVTVIPHLRSGRLKILAILSEMPIIPFGLLTHSSTENTPLLNAFNQLTKRTFEALEKDALLYASSGEFSTD